MEFTLTHDGTHWRAESGGISARAETLAGLDEALAERLLRAGHTDWPLEVIMRFDRNGLPGWMRQYAYHYFNRCVRLENLAERTIGEGQHAD